MEEMYLEVKLPNILVPKLEEYKNFKWVNSSTKTDEDINGETRKFVWFFSVKRLITKINNDYTKMYKQYNDVFFEEFGKEWKKMKKELKNEKNITNDK